MHRRLLVVGVLLACAAAATYGVLRASFGPRPVAVHVRWAPALGEAARTALERTHGLALPEPLAGRTWAYALTDLSRENIRALVQNPAVEDTHEIHRTAFRVGYLSPRLEYSTPRPWIPVGLEALAAALGILGLMAGALAALERTRPSAVRGPLRMMRTALLDPAEGARGFVRFLYGRIPAASAEAVAAYRIVYGSALVWFFLSRPVSSSWAAEPGTSFPAPHAVLAIFTATPWLGDWIQPWIVSWGVLFIIGAMTRVAFVMMTAGVIGWAVLWTTTTTYHTVSAPTMTLLLLTSSRWGDAWSVDAWLRRRWSRPPLPRGITPQAYGYTIWLPSFVIGVVFLAAAIAKLQQAGLAWITNGTVKYHFLSDSHQAMVGWADDIGPRHALAVALSFAAIAIEGVAIFAVCSRRYWVRLAGGGAGASLLIGFALLQGLAWPLWWFLMLAFLPWHLIRPPVAPAGAAASGAGSWTRRAQVALILLFLGQQAFVSATRVELAPLFSTYDMYSTTYASPDEYERKAGQTYWIMATGDDALERDCRIDEGQFTVIQAAVARAEIAAVRPFLDRCFGKEADLRTMFVEARKVRVNWAEWRMEEPARVRLIDAVALR